MIANWRAIAPAVRLAPGRPLFNYVSDAEDLDEAVASPAGMAALSDRRLAGTICSDRSLAAGLLRNTGLRAPVLPPAREPAAVVAVIGDGNAMLPDGRLGPFLDALAHEDGLTVVRAADDFAADAPWSRATGVTHCLDLRATDRQWAIGARRAPRWRCSVHRRR